jgi:YihY family inner membrane protein
MSTANFVPEMVALASGANPPESLGFRNVLVAGVSRFRAADATSIARAVGFQVVLSAIPAVIAVVAIATRLGDGSFRDLILSIFDSIAPGSTADLFRSVVQQGSDAAASSLWVIGGAVATTLASGTAGMLQVQRGANRIYGIEEDRPLRRRYGLALVLTVSFGLLFLAGFLFITLGDTVGSLLGDLQALWTWGRWPIGFVVVMVALTGLFKFAPFRHQPPLRWMMAGALLSVILWVVVTAGLALYLQASSTFGDVYGPLAGIIGLMLWAQLGSMAIFLGLAYTAQVEAHAANAPEPVSLLKKSLRGPLDEPPV